MKIAGSEYGRTDDEIYLAQRGLDATFPDVPDGVLYGCTLFRPGANYESIARALGDFNLLGIVGLAFNEQSMYSLTGRPEVREAFGRILQLAPPPIYVWSSISVEWALHFALATEIGGHPGWLAPSNVAPGKGITICTDVASAIEHALVNSPFLLEVPAKDKVHPPSTNIWNSYILTQFAQAYECRDNLVFSYEEREERLKNPVQPIARAVVDRAIELAKSTIHKILARQERLPTTYVLKAAFDAAFGPDLETDELGIPLSLSKPATVNTAEPTTAPALSAGPQKNKLPELVVGQPFDPAACYSEAYFGGGIQYTRTDGTKAVYYGPSKSWDGFDPVLEGMASILLPPTRKHAIRMLDVGCGYGDFIYRARMRDARFDAYGIDISNDAARGSAPPIRPYLVVGDVTNPNVRGLLAREPFHVVTAWDFWEHIYEEDVLELADAMHRILRPGGVMFSIICTRGQSETDFIHPKKGLVTTQNSWALVSGHVNIRTWQYWVELFARVGFQLRGDLGHTLLAALAGNPKMGTALSASWSPKNLLIVSRS